MLLASPSNYIEAHASIPLSPPTVEQQRLQQALIQLGAPVGQRRKPSTPVEDPVKIAVNDIISLMKAAEQAEDDGDYQTALNKYSTIINKYSDLALSERARVPRALLLYQLGKPEDALLLLEDESVALVGSAEVHAALAVVLHAERPRQVGRAEEQWEFATEFDKRYSDKEWVAKSRRWPPKMIAALDRFLNLQ